jgi:polar amino acid transport system permease protein
LLDLLAFGDAGWLDELLLGAFGTLALLIASFPIGLALGLGLAYVKFSREPTLRIWGNAVTSVLRGVPELLTLLLVYFYGQRLLNATTNSLGWERIEISVYGCGVAVLSMVLTAYASEVFLGSLRAMEKSSVEAARALGLGRFVTLRFVILPELLRLSEPGLSNLWLALLKRTALVSTISYTELLRQSQIAANSSGEYLWFYFIACLGYIALGRMTFPVFRYLIGYYRFKAYATAV